MRPVLSSSQMRQLDRETIDDAGVPGRALMELASDGVVRYLRELHRSTDTSPSALVLVGSGNNGGDGLVIARRLFIAGWSVEVVLAKQPSDLKGDAFGAWQSLEAEGFQSARIFGHETMESLKGLRVSFLIDALLGTGTDGDPRGAVGDMLEWQSAIEAEFRVSVDLPSGLHSDTGTCASTCFVADKTLAIGALKRGHVLASGPDVCGNVSVLDIGFSDRRIPKDVDFVVSAEDLGWLVPSRDRSAHKGTMGHVLAMVGSPEMPGAGRLVVEGSLYTGAGLVTWWVEREALDFVGLPPAALWMQRGPGTQALPERTRVWVCGSGLARNDALEAQIMNLFATLTNLPWVLDARAMTYFADWRMRHLDEERSVVLTPHPLELARLINASVEAVEADRRGAAIHAATLFRACVVLKGPGTVVASPSGKVRFVDAGNPGMARGGMGDVLAGVIGALLGQGMEPFEAASTGALWHAAAADHATIDTGEAALMPTEVAMALGRTLAANA